MDWSIDRSIDRLIDWLIDSLIDWLIAQFNWMNDNRNRIYLTLKSPGTQGHVWIDIKLSATSAQVFWQDIGSFDNLCKDRNDFLIEATQTLTVFPGLWKHLLSYLWFGIQNIRNPHRDSNWCKTYVYHIMYHYESRFPYFLCVTYLRWDATQHKQEELVNIDTNGRVIRHFSKPRDIRVSVPVWVPTGCLPQWLHCWVTKGKTCAN